MNENKTQINPCPYCSDTWAFFDRYDRQKYKMNCKCGFAWKVSGWHYTEKEAVEAWNKKIKPKQPAFKPRTARTASKTR